MTSPDPQRPFAQGRSAVPQPQFSAPTVPVARTGRNRRKAAIVGGGVLAFLLLCCGGAAVVNALGGDGSRSASGQENEADQQTQSDRESQGSPAGIQPGAAAGSSTPAQPKVEIRAVTTTEAVAFTEKRVNDSSLKKGTTQVRTPGRAGVKTLTFEVTFTDGVETARKLVSDVITTKPVEQVTAVGTKVEQAPQCDPNYTGACVPIASDVDCLGGSGNGPAYVKGPVTIIGTDKYKLDTDNDGIGCE